MFLAPPPYLTKAVQQWHTNQPHVRASLIFGDLSSSFWTADDSQGDIALGFGPGSRLLNHLVAKDAAEAAHTLSEVVKSTPSHGLATAAALIAAALEGSGGERVHRRCPSALALYLSRRDTCSPETWSVARGPPGARASSKGPRSGSRGWRARQKGDSRPVRIVGRRLDARPAPKTAGGGAEAGAARHRAELCALTKLKKSQI